MAAGLDRGRLELYLPATGRAVAQARAAVDQLETLESYPDARFAVRLLVSELFTNAVKYGRPGDARVRLSLEIGDTHVRGEVGDHGRGFTEVHVPMPDAEAESGRGLAFLDAIADRWGVIHDGEICVWFELDL
ncbi:MAG: serine/threonine-protein kinase RsbW [Gaiellaceae bacterium]|jgi:anti-sigma regulatory factor (Ser/Thr protein kinase)|nr:serine/threonine-protein kinase RsbW [Gaiellaceae bacterium]